MNKDIQSLIFTLAVIFAWMTLTAMADTPPIPTQDTNRLPVAMELRGGLVIKGEIDKARTLHCVSSFGEIEIPLAKLRGIRFHDRNDPSRGSLPDKLVATVVTDDVVSMMVSISQAHIQIKTEWGTADVELEQAKSLLTSDEVEWQRVDTRWMLSPIKKFEKAID